MKSKVYSRYRKDKDSDSGEPTTSWWFRALPFCCNCYHQRQMALLVPNVSMLRSSSLKINFYVKQNNPSFIQEKYRHLMISLHLKGGCIAQWKHSCLPPSSPGLKSWHRQDFFSLHLTWWTVLRSNPSSAKQWISQMQLAVTSRATKKVYVWFRLIDPWRWGRFLSLWNQLFRSISSF